MSDQEQEQSIASVKVTGDLVGKQLSNKYRIISLLGKGGMSCVYKAQHIILGKTFAIKVLHQKNLMDTESISRFKQEAAAAVRLSHPNIIAVHDFDVYDGSPFQAMDYLNGTSLDQELQMHGPLSLKRAVHVCMQICDAMRHAHNMGVIHRDLKPTNVMLVTHDGDPDFVKIVDFGIAKILPQEGEAVHQLTQTGEVFGSPWYMSPEQCLGKKVDARADIYSMGCLIYETLTGHPPFEGDSVLETIHKHMSDPPPSLAPAIKDKVAAARLDHLLCKAMAKDPADRYQSMDEMSADLKQITTGGGMLTSLYHRSAAMWLRAAASFRRAPTRVLAALVLTSAVCALLGANLLSSSANVRAFQPADWPLLSLQSRTRVDAGGGRSKFAMLQAVALSMNHDNPIQMARHARHMAAAESRTGDYDKSAQVARELRKLLSTPSVLKATEDPATVDSDVLADEYVSIAEGCYYAGQNRVNMSNALWFLDLADQALLDGSTESRNEISLMKADIFVRCEDYPSAQKTLLQIVGPLASAFPQAIFLSAPKGLADRALLFVDIAESGRALKKWQQASMAYNAGAAEWLACGVPNSQVYRAQCSFLAGTSDLKGGDKKEAVHQLSTAAALYSQLPENERTNLPAVLATLADAQRRTGDLWQATATDWQAHTAAWQLRQTTR